MTGLKMVALQAQSLNSTAGWGTQVVDEFKSLSGEVMPVLLSILGIALAIFGLQWGVRKAMKFFKSTTN